MTTRSPSPAAATTAATMTTGTATGPTGAATGPTGATTAEASPWGLDACQGLLVETCGGADTAVLTFATRLLLEAQRRGETSAWIAGPRSVFYPPDVEAAGVDLAALPVVRPSSGSLRAFARAADLLVRSGGFGLVVIDLGVRARWPLAVSTRLAGLARKHGAAIVVITERPTRTGPARTGPARTGPAREVSAGSPGSLGSMVSLRLETRRLAREDELVRCEVHATRDKRRGRAWRHEELCRAPDGLC